MTHWRRPISYHCPFKRSINLFEKKKFGIVVVILNKRESSYGNGNTFLFCFFQARRTERCDKHRRQRSRPATELAIFGIANQNLLFRICESEIFTLKSRSKAKQSWRSLNSISSDHRCHTSDAITYASKLPLTPSGSLLRQRTQPVLN